MDWLQICFWVFAAIATGGAGLTALMATGVTIPGWLGTAHGMAALAGLALLFGVNLGLGDALPALAWWALVVFIGGFVGGMLFFRVLMPGRAPVWLALGHGSVGVLGLCLLYLATFTR
ncbi:hypothetical protein [Algiphilus aromaticivorans]|uniref:hypothetical protein n=1 Tax=Algiphilus aromaticivorans TaxID=382454 RepID=UPI0005C1DC99|nr:hypothetical protein [Algiphilus aromaticivorans]